MLITGLVCGSHLPEDFCFPVFAPFAITVVIIPRSPSMSIVLKYFFRQMSQRRVTLVKENRIFLCNMHLHFSLSLLIQMKKSRIACEKSLKTKINLVWFCATGLLWWKHFLHLKTPKKCNLIQEISNNSWTDGKSVLFYYRDRAVPQSAIRHDTPLSDYIIIQKNPIVHTLW